MFVYHFCPRTKQETSKAIHFYSLLSAFNPHTRAEQRFRSTFFYCAFIHRSSSKQQKKTTILFLPLFSLSTIHTFQPIFNFSPPSTFKDYSSRTPPARAANPSPTEHNLPVSSAQIEDGGNITTATMTILVKRQHDGATLTCTASNPALSVPPLSDTAKLTVYCEYSKIAEGGKGTAGQGRREGRGNILRRKGVEDMKRSYN